MAQPSSHCVGRRLSFDGALCTVRYIGEVAGTNGTWLGVEWDDATRGKHDGSHKGTRYFTCISKSHTAASFVRPKRPADKPQSFIGALHEKYASDGDGVDPDAGVVIFGTKVAQEMGFDKIRRKLAQVEDLTVVILDGLRVASARDDNEPAIAERCPSITQLDLGRNLFESLAPVVEICGELQNLRTLRLSGNRFRDVLKDGALRSSQAAFSQVTELGLEETLLRWDELCRIATNFSALSSLYAGSNQLTILPSINYLSLATTVTTLDLEYNEFKAISDLGSLTALTALRSLLLKGNYIKQLAAADTEAPTFPPSLHYLDVSYNAIESWSFVDKLPTHFPGLTNLRISHNPVYETQDPDSKTSSTEEAHMFTIARLAALKTLNFSHITATDRSNAEMFYLSRIAKQLAAVPETAEDTVLVQHPRYAELCEIYGEPDIIRREEINPSYLEARLVTVSFHTLDEEKRTKRIPQSFDMYAVKGVAGKLFKLSPLKLRLVWETGEWDPVAEFYDREGDSSDEEDNAEGVSEQRNEIEQAEEDGRPGRWVKREVELKDGPRQLGYCVDGLNVTIRVERL